MTPAGKQSFQHDDDYFKDTRMSFGEHIEELRVRLWKAITWLVFFMVIGFVLDGIGSWLDLTLGRYHFGIGRPMLQVIAEPAEKAMQEYFDKRRAGVVAKWKAESDHQLKEVP